jgi:phosphoribosyl 1,2-cyclic phosphate phosphodiesterase
MHRIFPYITDKANALGLYRPMINFVDNAEPFAIGDLAVERLQVEHGYPCCGYLLGGTEGLAYISDCHELPDETVARLSGVGTLVLNCLRERPHPTHLNLERALAYIARIRPRRTYLIHLCHDIAHADWLRRLPDGVEPAYDGLELTI